MSGSDLITFGFLSAVPEKCVFTTFLFHLRALVSKVMVTHQHQPPKNTLRTREINQRSILSRSLDQRRHLVDGRCIAQEEGFC